MVSEGTSVSTVTHWFLASGFQLASLPVVYLLGPVMTWLRWVPSSKTQLIEAEKKVLACRRVLYAMLTRTKETQVPDKPCEILDVEIGSIGDVENCKIHTIKVPSSDNETKNTPLVLVHGFGCGGGIFAPNFDALSEKRDVYAIDMLGFGQSSRARLSSDAMEAEKEMVDSIEMWRQKLNLERMVLLGHSLGSFVSSAYALRHPSRIRHLILEDPWGYLEYDENYAERRSKYPLWTKGVLGLLGHVNVMSTFRAAGPYGPNMLKRLLGRRHPYMHDYFPEAPDTIPDYLYHCNVRRPTGEEFFRNLCEKFGFVKYPLCHRMQELSEDVKVTFIHGGESFLPRTPSATLQSLRGEDNIKVYVIEGAGHTIHLEKPLEFNKTVLKALSEIGEN